MHTEGLESGNDTEVVTREILREELSLYVAKGEFYEAMETMTDFIMAQNQELKHELRMEIHGLRIELKEEIKDLRISLCAMINETNQNVQRLIVFIEGYVTKNEDETARINSRLLRLERKSGLPDIEPHKLPLAQTLPAD